jgi:hypothetical protein
VLSRIGDIFTKTFAWPIQYVFVSPQAQQDLSISVGYEQRFTTIYTRESTADYLCCALMTLTKNDLLIALKHISNLVWHGSGLSPMKALPTLEALVHTVKVKGVMYIKNISLNSLRADELIMHLILPKV